MIEIKEVETIRELRKFVLFPFQLYKNNEFWVPPLIRHELTTLRWDKNPAFDCCEAKYWLAIRKDQVVGRIMGIINHAYIKKWKQEYARFGWIDFIDNENVSKLLLRNVETWAKSKGLKAVHGPLGFTDMDPEGTLIEGFNELGTMPDIYNYPYYSNHIEKSGYVKDVDWIEYQVTVPSKVPERLEKISNRILKKTKLRLVKTSRSRDILPLVRDLFEVYNEAYKDLYGMIPLTDGQIDFLLKQYFSQIVTDYVKIVVDENDKVAGFIIGMPSLSKALQKANGRLFPIGFAYLLKALKNKNIDLYLAAVRPDLQGRGINAILAAEFTRKCIINDCKYVEASKQLEHNSLIRAHMKLYDNRQHKRRRCYIKQL